MDNAQLALALAPLIAVGLALTVFSLRDLYVRPAKAVAGGNKWVWLAVILFIGTLGPIIYLFIGRTEPPMKEE